MAHKNRTYLLALLPFALIVLVFELVPLAVVVIRSFFPAGDIGFTLEHYAAILAKKLYRDAVLNSVLLALTSSLIGITAAFFGAKATYHSSPKVKGFFMSLLNMTSNFAGIPLAFAYIILLGNAGVLVLLGKSWGIEALANYNVYSFSGLLLTYIYFQIPMATILLLPAFEALRREWRESVNLLGGGSFTYWFRVGIPVLLPSLLGTFSILFSNAIAAYATAYALLGGNFSLLPIRISEQFVGDVVQRKEFGSALAVVLMLLMVAAVAVNNYVLKKNRAGGNDHG
ncbi:putative spermidine/putrescine transport system permease protein [Desulfitobacterium sp. LBE]|uniref:ABC transporter permease n=1 Tax=Desulfitobacterium sp. LBE TaxID=884086 RepID=UPI00119A3B1C|nr:ABC transporter permease subunit [Desulfitobacterium sp. LBE]TWH55967.1 putative spermidine/putrescine transport system permease protein [Desulfitobacterium sp. LBE]